MKTTNLVDRIRIEAETSAENYALLAIHDLVFFSGAWSPLLEDIANDHGCIILNEETGAALNFCHIPLPMPIEEQEGRCAASQERN